MRAVVQRVSRAGVVVDGETVAEIERGLLVLVGVGPGDTEREARALATKLVGLRIFPDREGRTNLSVEDVGGSVLVVSQFTLLGDVRKGRRPSFVGAAAPEVAEPLVEEVARSIGEAGVPARSGRFGASMEVHLVNDGPFTLVLESTDGKVQ